LDTVLNPFILFAGLALGAIGVFVALPRKERGASAFGALLAAIGAGAVVMTLMVTAGANRPNWFFYIFALLGLGSALRVITHQRPVYAALYFILTILASAGLFLILGAEFLTFALVIIYAGAILITYLFVIMLASQAPVEEEVVAISGYDAASRDPGAAAVVGFLLIGALTGLMNMGVPQIPPGPTNVSPDAVLAELPRKIERALIKDGMPDAFTLHKAAFIDNPRSPTPVQIRVSASDINLFEDAMKVADVENDTALSKYGPLIVIPDAGNRDDPTDDFAIIGLRAAPEGLKGDDLERVGMALIGEHPLALELAGVILLLAMVGAVILARKQIEIGDAERLEAARLMRGAA